MSMCGEKTSKIPKGRQKSLNQKTDKIMANKKETKEKRCTHNTSVNTKATVTQTPSKTRVSSGAPGG